MENVSLRYSLFNKSKFPNLFLLDSHLRCLDADIIYSCGVIGALTMWIPQLLGKTYVTNPDGLGWKRDKYNRLKKALLSLMVTVSYRLSDFMVFDSHGIKNNLFAKLHKRERFAVIAYGSDPNQYVLNNSEEVEKVLNKYDLKADAYHLVVSRLEPENNVHTIVQGYRSMAEPRFPLIIVGRKLNTKYVQQLLKFEDKNVRFIGGLYEENELEIVRAKCCSYVHGHSVGGTNPSLLEAMNSSNLCICHDNEFNREVTGDLGYYFSNDEELGKIFGRIEDIKRANEIAIKKSQLKSRALEAYSWSSIIKQYQQLFSSLK